MAFGRVAGVLDELRRAAAIAHQEPGGDPEFLHLLGHRRRLGIHAPVENQIGFLALDLGKDGLEVDGLVVGMLIGDHLDAGGQRRLLELGGQTSP